MTQKETQIQTLDLLRFPLALIVLAIHLFNFNPIHAGGITYNPANYPFYATMVDVIRTFFGGRSVPIYFFISGYFFFFGITEYTRNVYSKKMSNRVHTLFIPYVIWNSLAILLLAVKALPIFKNVIFNPVSFNFSIKSFLSAFWMYDGALSCIPGVEEVSTSAITSIDPINVTLWFLRELMLVVLLTPFIWKAIKANGIAYISILSALWFAINVFPFSGYAHKVITALFFFSLGAYMSINNRNMIYYFGKHAKLSAIIFLLSIVLMFMIDGDVVLFNIINSFGIISGLFVAFNISSYLLSKGMKVNRFLCTGSFFIYISHSLIYDRVTRIVCMIIKPHTAFGTVSMYLCSFAATVLLLLFIFGLLKRHTPKFLTFITGRR